MFQKESVKPRRIEYVGHYIGVDLGCGTGNVVPGYSLAGDLQYSSIELPISLVGYSSATCCGMGVLLFSYPLQIRPASNYGCHC